MTSGDQANQNATEEPAGNAFRLGLTVAIVSLVTDQIHKWWMINIYGIRLEQDRIAVTPFMDFVYVLNKGISYGMFAMDSQAGQTTLATISFLVATAIVYWLAKWHHTAMSAVGAGLIAGGAVGNGIDRLHLGGVADFILLHAFGYSWYVFNVADVAIVAGVVALLYDSFVPSRKTAAK